MESKLEKIEFTRESLIKLNSAARRLVAIEDREMSKCRSKIFKDKSKYNRKSKHKVNLD